MYLNVNNVTKKEGSETLLNDVSFGLFKGEALSIMGQNPKSIRAIMRILAGKDEATYGSVTIDGKHPKDFKRLVYLPSDYRLLPHRTLEENMLLPLQLKGFKRQDAKKIAIEQLRLFQIERFKDYYPCQLSQSIMRVATIAEIGLFDADIILLEHPFAEVSNEHRMTLYRYLNSKRLEGVTLILATTELEEAEYLTEKTVFVDKVFSA